MLAHPLTLTFSENVSMNIYSTKKNIPYTYLIGWSKHNKWYYGSRSSKYCHPSEFWKTYFTSSKYVNSFRIRFGEPDVIQIRKTFTKSHDCLIWEHKVLRRIKADVSNLFLNENIGSSKFNTANKAPAKTKEGIKIGLVSLDDNRWKTGEIVGLQKNVPNKSGAKLKETRKIKYWSSTSDISKENNRKAALKWHSDPNKNKKHREALQSQDYKLKQSKKNDRK